MRPVKRWPGRRVAPGSDKVAWAMWALGASGYLAAVFHRMSLSVSGIAAQHHLGVGSPGLAALGAVELAAYVVMQIPSGVGADRFGPRRMIGLGLLLMGAGSAIFATAPGLGLALVGRVLVGVGDALQFVNVLRLARSWFSGRLFAIVVSLTAVAGALGQFLATVPFAWLLGAVGWTDAFVVASVASVALGGVALVFLRDAPAGAAEEKGDPVRPVPASGLRFSLAESWSEAGTRLAFWSHLVLVGSFVAFSGLWGVPYLRQVLRLPVSEAGGLVGATVAAALVLNPLVGRYVSRHPGRRGRFLVASGLLSAAPWALCAVAPAGGAVLVFLVILVLLVGFSNAAAVASFDVVRSANPLHRAGTASGLVNMAGFGFAVVAEVGVGALLPWLHGEGLSTAASFRWAFGAVFLLALAGTQRIAVARRAFDAPGRQVAPSLHLGGQGGTASAAGGSGAGSELAEACAGPA